MIQQKHACWRIRSLKPYGSKILIIDLFSIGTMLEGFWTLQVGNVLLQSNSCLHIYHPLNLVCIYNPGHEAHAHSSCYCKVVIIFKRTPVIAGKLTKKTCTQIFKHALKSSNALIMFVFICMLLNCTQHL
jgi:hypothetical protein